MNVVTKRVTVLRSVPMVSRVAHGANCMALAESCGKECSGEAVDSSNLAAADFISNVLSCRCIRMTSQHRQFHAVSTLLASCVTLSYIAPETQSNILYLPHAHQRYS